MASPAILNTLKAAITQKPPFCTGVIPVVGDQAAFAYRKGDGSCWLDLAHATDAQLQALAEACEPATFGVDQRDVLDESYRKAGKMDSEKFITKFDVDRLRIVEYVREQLLDGADEDKNIRAELYKLNVYGKDSFFKSHKDTPRGSTMFGSLVVVFPTVHEGGALVLRHGDREWTFDSAALTQNQAEPSVAYIAFYSDVDHEVTLVTSGYRVTLTYNLFFEASRTQLILPESSRHATPDDKPLHAALSAALADPTFLPDGGYLGFGLNFKYPLSQGDSKESRGTTVLKGSDAVVDRVCRGLSLTTTLNVVYHPDDQHNLFLVPATERISRDWERDGIVTSLLDLHHGKVIHKFGEPAPEYDGVYYEPENLIRLAWVTPLTEYSRFESTFVTYGNEPASEYIYGDLCLAVEVGPHGNRQAGCPLYVPDPKDKVKRKRYRYGPQYGSEAEDQDDEIDEDQNDEDHDDEDHDDEDYDDEDHDEDHDNEDQDDEGTLRGHKRVRMEE